MQTRRLASKLALLSVDTITRVQLFIKAVRNVSSVWRSLTAFILWRFQPVRVYWRRLNERNCFCPSAWNQSTSYRRAHSQCTLFGLKQMAVDIVFINFCSRRLGSLLLNSRCGFPTSLSAFSEDICTILTPTNNWSCRDGCELYRAISVKYDTTMWSHWKLDKLSCPIFRRSMSRAGCRRSGANKWRAMCSQHALYPLNAMQSHDAMTSGHTVTSERPGSDLTA
jgi:hypothetical protein